MPLVRQLRRSGIWSLMGAAPTELDSASEAGRYYRPVAPDGAAGRLVAGKDPYQVQAGYATLSKCFTTGGLACKLAKRLECAVFPDFREQNHTATGRTSDFVNDPGWDSSPFSRRLDSTMV
jgi:hypothetical protein